MECNCIHFKTCRFWPALFSGFGSLIPMHIGGRSPLWDNVVPVIEKVCQYRTDPTALKKVVQDFGSCINYDVDRCVHKYCENCKDYKEE